MQLNAFLAAAVEHGGSDLHLKVGTPPMARIDGVLRPLGETALTDADVEAALAAVTERTPAKRQQFDETGDLDTAYVVEGLGRFRVNGFRQRGAISFAFRHVPKDIPTLRAAQPALRRADPCRGAPRAHPRDRRDGLREVHDARRDGRQDQPVAEAAHRHDRGPDRDRPPGPRLHREPARGRPRHRVVQAGAPPRAPPGPRRDPDRRAPRRGDRPRRAPGGRVRPPRPLDAAHARRGRDDRAADRVLPADEAADDPPDHRGRAARRRQPAPASRRLGGGRDRRGRGDAEHRPDRGPDPRPAEDRRDPRGDRGGGVPPHAELLAAPRRARARGARRLRDGGRGRNEPPRLRDRRPAGGTREAGRGERRRAEDATERLPGTTRIRHRRWIRFRHTTRRSRPGPCGSPRNPHAAPLPRPPTHRRGAFGHGRARRAAVPASELHDAERARLGRAHVRARGRRRPGPRHGPTRSSSRSGERPAPRTASRGKSSAPSTRSSRTSAGTWARAPRARSGGCSSSRPRGSGGGWTATATASRVPGIRRTASTPPLGISPRPAPRAICAARSSRTTTPTGT